VRGPVPSRQLVEEREAAIRPLPERHAAAFALERLDAETAEVLADRVEDPAERHMVLVGFPRFAVIASALWNVSRIAPVDGAFIRRRRGYRQSQKWTAPAS
jgi:hypothetical protein